MTGSRFSVASQLTTELKDVVIRLRVQFLKHGAKGGFKVGTDMCRLECAARTLVSPGRVVRPPGLAEFIPFSERHDHRGENACRVFER